MVQMESSSMGEFDARWLVSYPGIENSDRKLMSVTFSRKEHMLSELTIYRISGSIDGEGSLILAQQVVRFFSGQHGECLLRSGGACTKKSSSGRCESA